MPNFHYAFLVGAGAPNVCGGGGPGAPLVGIPNPVAIPWPALLNAQLRLGVYPGGWVMDEINWRVYAFCIGCVAVAGGAVPIPAAPPALGVVAPVAAVGAGGGVANVAASPVAVGVDATEKGQIGYHMGTAAGGTMGTYMATNGPGGTAWFAFHLSRAVANGGVFTLAPGGAPDIVTFAVDPATLNVFEFVVWENKGHCGNFGALAAVLPALVQAQLLLNMTVIPGNPAIGVLGGTPVAGLGGGPNIPPNAHVASQVDIVGGNFRIQVIDPPRSPWPPLKLSPGSMDAFLRAYYAPFVEAVGRKSVSRGYDGARFDTAEFAKQVRLGLHGEILRAYRGAGAPGSFSKAVARAIGGGFANTSSDTVYVHPTGISTEIPRGWRPNEAWGRRSSGHGA